MSGSERQQPDDGPSAEHEAFFEKAFDAASEWARFADPKALAVLAVMGLALSNLLRYARDLSQAYEQGGLAGWGATVSFYLALLFAVATVGCVAGAVISRLSVGAFPTRKKETQLFYFAGVANYKDAAEYEQAVRSRSARELESEIAAQVYAVAGVAASKHVWTQRAYIAVLLFLAAWSLSRAALSFL